MFKVSINPNQLFVKVVYKVICQQNGCIGDPDWCSVRTSNPGVSRGTGVRFALWCAIFIIKKKTFPLHNSQQSLKFERLILLKIAYDILKYCSTESFRRPNLSPNKTRLSNRLNNQGVEGMIRTSPNRMRQSPDADLFIPTDPLGAGSGLNEHDDLLRDTGDLDEFNQMQNDYDEDDIAVVPGLTGNRMTAGFYFHYQRKILIIVLMVLGRMPQWEDSTTTLMTMEETYLPKREAQSRT